MRSKDTRSSVGISISVALLVAFILLAFSSHHTLKQASRRLLFDPKSIRNKNDLRFLTFGSSITWGAHIPDGTPKDAFPYILSNDVTNLALRAHGPNLASLCTQSMVGDTRFYDVIVLEYFMRAEEGLLLLAQRLRQRFPKATIIFLQLWYPAMFYKEVEGSFIFMHDWAIANGVGGEGSLWDDKLYKKLMETPRNEWALAPFQESQDVMNQAIHAVGGLLYQLPMPRADPRKAVIEAARWFNPDDWHHLSAEGHAMVARGIHEILKEHGVTRHDHVEPWRHGDICASWFATGECSLPYEGEMKAFANSKTGPKWSLEMMVRNSSLEITNPFDEPRQLHLSYMVSGPPPSIYPKTRVSFNKPGLKSIDIDPTSYVQDGHFVHIVQTTPVAIIPPREKVTLQFENIDSGKRIEYKGELHPFRLTGYAITSNLDESFREVNSNTFLDFSSSIETSGND